MRAADLVIRSRRVVTPDEVTSGAVHVRNGIIERIAAHDDVPPGCHVLDTDGVVMPGLVDTHVHVNEPGRTEWEGFATATRAAAAGGITCLVDMPLNSVPPTTTPAALEEKLAAADGQCHVDVGFWGGVVPGNLPALAPLHEAGVFGFKCFLVASGVDEFPPVDWDDLDAAMRRLAELDALLLVHAEAPGPIAKACQALTAAGADTHRYRTWLDSRPTEAEDEAIAQLLERSRAYGCQVHILHLSSAGALEELARARADGVPVSVETTPHYLVLAAEEVPDGAVEHKCAPPIRERDNRERLWEGLEAGIIDAVVSDHSPCTPDLKHTGGDFLTAWGGIASLQLGLPLLWTTARERGHGVGAVAKWMAQAPAGLAGLVGKGVLAPGSDADVVVWHPDTSFTVDPAALQHRHPVTPYAGRRLHGVVEATYVRGVEVYRDGRFRDVPAGRLLRRAAA